MAESTVTLLSSDGASVEVSERIACMSVTVSNMIADIGRDELSAGIPLPNVKLEVLKKVIEYCTRHVDDPPTAEAPEPEPVPRRTDDITADDQAFMNVEQPMLFDIILVRRLRTVPTTVCRLPTTWTSSRCWTWDARPWPT
jgi:S-phase kinase-associated protein 1